MNILLVEPDKILCKIYERAFIRHGYEVMIANGAQQAIALADEVTPDIIVLELQLSEHGGVEFLYELRSYSEWQSIPVIIHSMVNISNDDFASALNVRKILYKPATNLKFLVETVQQVQLLQLSKTTKSKSIHE